jgi:long-subunit fatty acid transport protein
MAREWNDTFAVRLGLTYELTPDVGVVWGAGYESAASPDATLDPATPDAPSVRMALGARIALTRNLTGTVGITGVASFVRDNTGKSTLSTYDLPARRADGGGVYELWLALLSLGLEMHL